MKASSKNMYSIEPNKDTVEAYNRSFQEYIKNTPQAHQSYHTDMLNWIDKALSFIPPSGNILEIGSATPRDARYMRSKGYSVQCSDAAEKFVNYLNSQGENALLIDLLNDSLGNDYDMIFANAVLNHFTKTEVRRILEKVYSTIKAGSVFAFNVKLGQGETWITEKISEKRFVHYWQTNEVKILSEQCGFKVVFMQNDAPGDLPNHIWVNIVAQKSL